MSTDFRLSRRQTLAALFLLGTSCVPAGSDRDARKSLLPDENGTEPPAPSGDAVDALFDVLIPGETGSAGAREAGTDAVLRAKGFVPIAIAQGLLPDLPDAIVNAVEDGRGALRAALAAELDALASSERPLSRFAELPRDRQEAIAERIFDDQTHGPAMLVVRAACFFAFLGGFTNDLGLRAIGFAPFEDLADGRAVSGYPRTKKGRLVDASKEDLAALARANDLDDYTYAKAPAATPGVSLADHLDAAGDLV